MDARYVCRIKILFIYLTPWKSMQNFSQEYNTPGLLINLGTTVDVVENVYPYTLHIHTWHNVPLHTSDC